MRTLRRHALLCLLLAGLHSPAAAANLTFAIQPVHGSDRLVLDSPRYQTPERESFSISRLSMLLSGFALQKKDETGWTELPGAFAWIDSGARRLESRLDVPAGQYVSLRFFVGPDEDTNRENPSQWPADHPLNSNLNRMHWSWQGGYIFLALEGHYQARGLQLQGWSWHFARDPNRTSVVIPVDLAVRENSTSSVLLEFDLAKLFSARRELSFSRDGDSSHSREGDIIAAGLRENLPASFRLREISQSGNSAPRLAAKPLFLPAQFTPYRFHVGSGFSIPALPSDNPLINERVELGERLFRDPLLSRDGTLSCASCHLPEHGFSEPRPVSIGVAGGKGRRNAMPLMNLAWKSTFFWDGRAPSLRAQALMPIRT